VNFASLHNRYIAVLKNLDFKSLQEWI